MKKAGLIIAVFALVYAAISFIKYESDPFLWGIGVRYCFVLIATAASGIVLVNDNINKLLSQENINKK